MPLRRQRPYLPFVLALAVLVAACDNGVLSNPASPTQGIVNTSGALQVGAQSIVVGLATERADNPLSSVIPANMVGVVCFVADQPGVTLTAVPGDKILEPFTELLAVGGSHVESPTLVVDLPTQSGVSDIDGQPCDIVLFDDANGNGRLDDRETYISAWNGGADSYRLVYLTAPASDRIGAGPGWNLVRGGFPVTYQSDLTKVIILVDPVVGPVPR